MKEEQKTEEGKYGCLCYAQPNGEQCYKPVAWRVQLNDKWFFVCSEHGGNRWKEWDTVLPLECEQLRVDKRALLSRIAEREEEVRDLKAKLTVAEVALKNVSKPNAVIYTDDPKKATPPSGLGDKGE